MSVVQLPHRCHDLLNCCELTGTIQGRLARCLAACPMATGLASGGKSRSMEPPFWKKVLSLTQVSFWIFDISRFLDFQNIFSALQCWLECDPGYVAQRVPLITCVDGQYAKGCHYFQKNCQIFSIMNLALLLGKFIYMVNVTFLQVIFRCILLLLSLESSF